VVHREALMTLWDELSAICLVTPVAVGAAVAHTVRARVGGHAFGIALGLVIGGGAVWGMQRAANATMSRIADFPESQQNWHCLILFVGAMVWTVFTTFGTGAIVSAFLH
jgi:hypothetical protein